MLFSVAWVTYSAVLYKFFRGSAKGIKRSIEGYKPEPETGLA